ncbi:hypothetical protein E4U49_007453 [Claviceps purpurea]|nr:hypothetical protein E4U49_007453 [Claviceps purpurea]
MAPQKTIQLEGIKVSTDCKSLENVEDAGEVSGPASTVYTATGRFDGVDGSVAAGNNANK